MRRSFFNVAGWRNATNFLPSLLCIKLLSIRYSIGMRCVHW
jgi:hypothetical protein